MKYLKNINESKSFKEELSSLKDALVDISDERNILFETKSYESLDPIYIENFIYDYIMTNDLRESLQEIDDCFLVIGDEIEYKKSIFVLISFGDRSVACLDIVNPENIKINVMGGPIRSIGNDEWAKWARNKIKLLISESKYSIQVFYSLGQNWYKGIKSQTKEFKSSMVSRGYKVSIDVGLPHSSNKYINGGITVHLDTDQPFNL